MKDSINVTLTMRHSETNEVLKTIKKHNIVSKAAVLSLVRLIDGKFCNADNKNLNRSGRLALDNYIPHYFAMGSNVASSESYGVSSISTINDSRLLSEYTDYPRMRISQRNLIENKPTNPYVKLNIRHYVPVSAYPEYKLGEAGLFTSETGNSCWARVTFEPFIKEPLTVIDVLWEITIVSLESTNQIYDTIDKSSLWNAMEDACIKIREETPKLESFSNALQQAMKDYGSDTVTQEEVDRSEEELRGSMK